MNISEAMDKLKALLLADAYFSGFTVLLDGTGLPANEGGALESIASQWADAIDAKGLVLTVYLEDGSPVDEDVEQVELDSQFGIDIAENPFINHGTGGFKKPLIEVLRKVLKTLHYTEYDPPFDYRIKVGSPAFVRNDDPESGVNGYTAFFMVTTDEIST